MELYLRKTSSEATPHAESTRRASRCRSSCLGDAGEHRRHQANPILRNGSTRTFSQDQEHSLPERLAKGGFPLHNFLEIIHAGSAGKLLTEIDAQMIMGFFFRNRDHRPAQGRYRRAIFPQIQEHLQRSSWPG
jgi:hypothetical protein